MKSSAATAVARRQASRVASKPALARLAGLDRRRDRLEDRPLGVEQVGRVVARPVEQGELEQQVGADVADVLDRGAAASAPAAALPAGVAVYTVRCGPAPRSVPSGAIRSASSRRPMAR